MPLKSDLRIKESSALKPECPQDQRIFQTLATYCGQSKTVTIFPVPRLIQIDYRPANLPTHRKKTDTLELNVTRLIFRMVAIYGAGVKAGVILVHNGEDGKEIEVDFVLDWMTWPSLHALHNMAVRYVTPNKNLGRPKKIKP